MDPTRAQLRELLDNIGCSRTPLTADGKIPAVAGADPGAVAQPLGGATISGTVVSIDTYVNPPTKIPSIVRNLVADNRGYFAESIFATPGTRVMGGAVQYEITDPEDLFLPADQGYAPRAPGAEAPRLGSKRPAPLIARPQSWSGSIEVTDEARTRNDTISVSNQFTRAANSLADRIQTTAMATLQAFVEGQSRQLESEAGKWSTELKEGVLKADPATLPLRDFAMVEAAFIADKAGVLPDTLIIHPSDWINLVTVYSTFTGGVQEILNQFGIDRVIRSVLAPEGEPYFLKRGAVGQMLFEKPLTQEKTREGTRFTDVFTLDVAPVLVAYDQTAIYQLQKIA